MVQQCNQHLQVERFTQEAKTTSASLVTAPGLVPVAVQGRKASGSWTAT